MEFYTRKDIMNRYNICERTLSRWMALKKIPFIKSPLNNRIYFDKQEIEKWEQKVMPTLKID